jgi:hypothetical protein
MALADRTHAATGEFADDAIEAISCRRRHRALAVFGNHIAAIAIEADESMVGMAWLGIRGTGGRRR